MPLLLRLRLMIVAALSGKRPEGLRFYCFVNEAQPECRIPIAYELLSQIGLIAPRRFRVSIGFSILIEQNGNYHVQSDKQPSSSDAGGKTSSRLAQLFQLLEHHLALKPRKVIDEQDPFKVVHLVLKASRHQAFHGFLVKLAVNILPAGADFGGAFDISVNLGD